MSQCLYLEILRQCWGRGSKFGYSSSRLMHQCIFGDDILHQCWGRGSKLDYTFSRLTVYIWKFYVSVGAGEAS